MTLPAPGFSIPSGRTSLTLTTAIGSIDSHRESISRPSTRLPFRHALPLPEYAHPSLFSQRFHHPLVPALDHALDLSAGSDQKCGGDCRNPVVVAHFEIVLLVIEQRGKRDPELLVELACVSGVVLADAVHAHLAPRVQAFNKRK